MSAVVNIAAYQFAALHELQALRSQLIGVCRDWRLKGTILLSTEGVNLFVAGGAEEIGRLLALLRAVPGLEGLQAKFSESRDQPFTRMLVKIKKEIIAFGVETVDPVDRPAPRLSPQELKRWLDEGRPVTLLDTRNDFEVSMGTFQNAVPIHIDHFRDFPAAADKLMPTDFPNPIVTFCTGGIRCEKAAPYLIQKGFEQVYQLDGGILKYFEECGSDHYQGECFVFDKRVGLAADLNESKHGFCFACQNVLTPEELTDPRTVEGISCPRCYRSAEESQQQGLEARRQKLKEVTSPLPGKEPQDNFRPLRIAARHSGWTLIDFLCDVLPFISREDWQCRCDAGELVDRDQIAVASTQIVQPGEAYFTVERQLSEPDINPNIEILHEDEALIVVYKPAPLPMHPSGRFNRNTLQSILQRVYAPQKPRPGHRLDANTSGIAVFTRTAAYARALQPQFERGDVTKRYLARVIGHPPADTFQCDAPLTQGQGHCGASIVAADGLPSLTEFAVLSRLSDGTTLLCVTPKTGRTNQIRAHLWHLGWPIVGDTIYLPDHQLGNVQTLQVGEAPMCLHAWQLTIRHPEHGKTVTYEAPPPDWAADGLSVTPAGRL